MTNTRRAAVREYYRQLDQLLYDLSNVVDEEAGEPSAPDLEAACDGIRTAMRSLRAALAADAPEAVTP